jgi:MoxR-like ATPase
MTEAASDPRAAVLALREEVAKVVVGQEGVLSGLVAALLVRGHVLLEGVPGVAKTLVVKALARSLDLRFQRVQFTPDLMPSDVIGQVVYDSKGASFSFREGPVFTNLLLADEINRTPPKTQAALLESMEERQVSVEGDAHPLPEPFVVVATQNPVEHEGTYPLPEAQLDRFLFKLHVGYPTAEQEAEVLARHDAGLDPHDLEAAGVRAVAGAADLDAARRQVASLTVEPPVRSYVVELVRATRVAPAVALGVSPRGATALLHASKAWAWLAGRPFVTPDEVKAVAKPALRHRLQLRPEVELEGATADSVLDGILASVPAPR